MTNDLIVQRLAITQRVTFNSDYDECRDTLSQDWVKWLAYVFPHAAVLSVPNAPSQLDTWLDIVKPNAVILTGGNDWETAIDRDETEKRLINRARSEHLPILGVCRGLQILNVVLGGTIIEDLTTFTKETHVASEHTVTITGCVHDLIKPNSSLRVNSFHNQGVHRTQIAPGLVVFANTEDNIVEGFYHKSEPILAIQWHPERQSPSAFLDKLLITKLFQQGAFWAR